MRTLKILLTEKDFSDLIAGKTITRAHINMYENSFEIKIALQDIGYITMINQLLLRYKELLDQQGLTP